VTWAKVEQHENLFTIDSAPNSREKSRKIFGKGLSLRNDKARAAALVLSRRRQNEDQIGGGDLEEVAEQNPAVEGGDVEIRRRGCLGGHANPGDEHDGGEEEGVAEFGSRGGESLAEGVGNDAGERGEEEDERGADGVGADRNYFEHGDECRGGGREDDAAED
jgi:hypothetical protein